MVKVAIVQMKSSIDKVENLTFSLEQIKKAGNEKAQIICFPEFQMAFSPNSQSSKALFSISESVEDNFIKELCKSAKKNNIYVVGTIYERSFVDSDALNGTSNKKKDVNVKLGETKDKNRQYFFKYNKQNNMNGNGFNFKMPLEFIFSSVYRFHMLSCFAVDSSLFGYFTVGL